MRLLDRKLLRDLDRQRGPAVTIALVVACGVASLVSLLGTWEGIAGGRASYYVQSRFAHVFAHVTRCPESRAAPLRTAPGVSQLETRIVKEVRLDVLGMRDPPRARLVSLPPFGEPLLNAIHLREGRLPEATREVVASEGFARAHRMHPGDTLQAIIEGRRQTLTVVGIGLSPEYVYVMNPGSFVPDDRAYGVLWTRRPWLASAFAMDGVFNDLVVRVGREADVTPVIHAVDAALDPCGNAGAYGRNRQMSDRFLAGEIQQLRGTARVLPAMFLGVAAFLLHVVLSRLIQTQREQVATLKALGFDARAIGMHYLRFGAVIVGAGALLGVAGGAWLGDVFMELYRPYFRFPDMAFHATAENVGLSVAVTGGVTVVGVLRAVQSVIRLPPAQAMRPEPPVDYRAGLFDRAGLATLFPAAMRMVLRDLVRAPLRVGLSVLGVACAISLVLLARFSSDAIDHIMRVQYGRASREDVTVGFARPAPLTVADTLRRLPGVRALQLGRDIPVRLARGHRVRTLSLRGVDVFGDLSRVVDLDGAPLPIPAGEVMLSRRLAGFLDARVGDEVIATPLEGRRDPIPLRVGALVDDMMGLAATTSLDALARMTGEAPAATQALLATDPLRDEALVARLREMAMVTSVTRRAAAIRYFREESAGMLLMFTAIISIFAGIIAVGIVYNNARVALAMRARELATMRVLGFTEAEVTGLLAGEQLAQVALAVGPGLLLGRYIARQMVEMADPELFALPLRLTVFSHVFAAAVVLAASVASIGLLRRRVRALDLVAVLKARD